MKGVGFRKGAGMGKGYYSHYGGQANGKGKGGYNNDYHFNPNSWWGYRGGGQALYQQGSKGRGVFMTTTPNRWSRKQKGNSKGASAKKEEEEEEKEKDDGNEQEEKTADYWCWSCKTDHNYAKGDKWWRDKTCRNKKCKAPIVGHLQNEEARRPRSTRRTSRKGREPRHSIWTSQWKTRTNTRSWRRSNSKQEAKMAKKEKQQRSR